ncbi:hypothetical protein, partial [Armatimonas sp.]|uniref:hypothetical protein n=1 Tax=Armatimonas sp. TaxID=1872638 RepID=UPI003751775A
LPTRLGVLALATFVGIVGCVALAAKQNGTDVGSFVSTLDFGKAYSKQNINYTLAGVKLKMGDRKGAAALIQTLPFREGEEDHQSYGDLRTDLIKAQITAGEFREALRSAQNDKDLLVAVLSAQGQRQGLDTTLANASSLPEPERSTALAPLVTQLAGQGDTAVAERLVEQLIPTTREGIYTSLMSAYYKAGNLPAALTAVQRVTDKAKQEADLSTLGNSCVTAKDSAGLRRVLELLPQRASPRKIVQVGTTTPSVTTTYFSARQQLLQQSVHFLGSPEVSLELIRTYAHPDDLPELLRSLLSIARGKKQGNETTQTTALALLRTQTSDEGKKAYDQEVHQLFYSDLDTFSDPLALAQTIHDEQMRGQVLLTLGQHWLERGNFQLQKAEPVLKALRVLSLDEAHRNHDYLVTNAIQRLQNTHDLPNAKRLAQQILDPEQRKKLLDSLSRN